MPGHFGDNPLSSVSSWWWMSCSSSAYRRTTSWRRAWQRALWYVTVDYGYGGRNSDNDDPWFSIHVLSMTHLIGLSTVMHLYLGRLSTDLSKIASAALASLPSARGTVLGSLKASNASYIQLNSCEKVPQTLTVHAEWYRQTSVQIKRLHADRNHEFSLITLSRWNMPSFSCLPAAISIFHQSFVSSCAQVIYFKVFNVIAPMRRNLSRVPISHWCRGTF